MQRPSAEDRPGLDSRTAIIRVGSGSPRSRFAGVRLPAAVFLAALAGGAGGLAALLGLDLLEERAALAQSRALAARVEAGRAALAALAELRGGLREAEGQALLAERRAAEGRASSLALLASRMVEQEPDWERALARVPARALDEHLSLIQWPEGVVLASRTPGLTVGATLAVALPQLEAAAGERRRERAQPVVAVDAQWAWALGPVLLDGRSVLSQTPVARSAFPAATLARAESALVDLAAEESPEVFDRSGPWVLALAALAGALLAAGWARWRLSRPLVGALDAARDFVHGRGEARAPERGGREARETARAVNALIEGVERARSQGRALRDENVHALALALEAVGKGELAGRVPEVGEALEPLRRAVDVAQRGLLERVQAIHQAALGVAQSGAELQPGAARVAAAALEQLEVLRAIDAGSEEGLRRLKEAHQRLGAALVELGRYVEGERKASGELQAGLRTVSRRVVDLSRGLGQLESLLSATAALRESLELLAQSGQSNVATPRARLSAAVGQGRAALDTLERELAAAKGQLAETAESLERTAGALPRSPLVLQGAVIAALQESSGALLAVLERSASALKTIERTSRMMADAAGDMVQGARNAAERVPALTSALSEVSTGGAFERELLERLERSREQALQAMSATDGLSPSGRALVQQIAEAAEAARARLSRLIAAAEATSEVLRR